ncbi:MAG: hypothetical protein ACI4JJ_00535 [Huintestinicola sp.]
MKNKLSALSAIILAAVLSSCSTVPAGTDATDTSPAEASSDTTISLSETSANTTTAKEETSVDTTTSEETTTASESETVASSAETTAETTLAEEPQTKPNTTPITPEPSVDLSSYNPSFFSDEAERLYSVIVSDMSWRNDNTIGICLMNIPQDGALRAIVSDLDGEHRIYSLDGEAMSLDYSVKFSSGILKSFCDNGTEKYYFYDTDTKYNDDSGYNILTRFGLVTFGDTEAVIETLFNAEETFDSASDTYSCKTYISGEEYKSETLTEFSGKPSDSKKAYNSWLEKAKAWEEENLADSITKSLSDIDFNNFDGRNSTPKTNEELLPDINEMVNSYFVLELKPDLSPFEVVAKKPVIYLYPEKETDISVSLDINGRLTCTYPDYEGCWNVTAEPDGTLYTGGSEYSYLYWEADIIADWDLSEGFVVKGSDTAEFLREKLSYMGLTPKEYNEFIVYWLPLMQDNPYNLITFQTDAYTDSAKLNISPSPDSMLRICMVYKPLDKYIDIPEQQLEAWERTGFAVVEWGGAEYLG